MAMQFPSDPKLPLNRFSPYCNGFIFPSLKLGEGATLWCEEDTTINLGIVEVHQITVGKDGVSAGFWFNTSHRYVHLPNGLTVYRKKLVGVSTKDILKSKSTVTLKYRLPSLRIFTQGSDLVVIGSDLPDMMKHKLDTQD